MSRREEEDFMFYKANWFAVDRNQRERMADDIANYSADKLLNTSTEDLARYYAAEFYVDVPTLDVENIVVDQRETKIDVSQDQMRIISDRSQPFYIDAIAIDVEVPFVGDAQVFHIQPSTYDYNPPRGFISGNSFCFTVSGDKLTADEVQKEIDRRVASLSQYLENLRINADPLNAQLQALATEHIERRKAKLLANRSLVSGLSFKVKEKQGASRTFVAPKVKRRAKPQKPNASSEPYQPEPVLDLGEYKHILSVLENMVTVMEQSPAAFATMDEESMRTHFLVHLNGHYEGDATGETFNFDGKTDILIKVDGRNIFISECKFWRGEATFLETIDQLLGYVTWRDTKAAVLVFNRNRDFSAVVEKAQAATFKHPLCKKKIEQQSETSASYLFAQPDDANREMTVTVQIYNVPQHIEPRIRAV